MSFAAQYKAVESGRAKVTQPCGSANFNRCLSATVQCWTGNNWSDARTLELQCMQAADQPEDALAAPVAGARRAVAAAAEPAAETPEARTPAKRPAPCVDQV
jgi:hypothetical protein